MRREGNGRKVYMKLSTALKNVDVLRLRERCGGMGIDLKILAKRFRKRKIEMPRGRQGERYSLA